MVELFLILDAHFAERLFRMILETVDLLIRRRQTATSLFGGGCDGCRPLGAIALYNGSAGGGPVTGISIETAHPVPYSSSRRAVEFTIGVVAQRSGNSVIAGPTAFQVSTGAGCVLSVITGHVAGEVQDRFGSLVVTHHVVTVTAGHRVYIVRSFGWSTRERSSRPFAAIELALGVIRLIVAFILWIGRGQDHLGAIQIAAD